MDDEEGTDAVLLVDGAALVEDVSVVELAALVELAAAVVELVALFAVLVGYGDATSLAELLEELSAAAATKPARQRTARETFILREREE